MMKKLTTSLLLIALIFTFCSCGSGSYDEGFVAGYDAGFRAAMESIQAVATEAPTVPQATIPPAPRIVPQPDNGHIFENLDMKGVAPLSIETVGSGGYYFVLDPITLSTPSNDDFESRYQEWKHAKTQEDSYIIFYVRGGWSVEIDVPLGEYEVYYATGDQWCGEDELFGDSTRYYKCDEIFDFVEEEDGFIGWTISLEAVANGNLDTKSINASDFPV